MNERLYSPFWYRVADLRPRLRSHIRIHRHHYRGELCYVLQNAFDRRTYRFTPNAYTLLGLMDGKRTVQEVWDHANEQLTDDAPTQSQVIQLIGQLHAAEALQCDVLPDTAEFFKRSEIQRRRKRIGQILNPFSWRFPLFDPERLLCRLIPLVRPAFSKLGFILWFGVVATGLTFACMHWQDLTENIVDRVLSPENLLILWLLYPILKGLHEFGHAFAVKAYGGEVHEMGIIFLVLTPLPYVDASEASTFTRKRQRIVVSAAGMMVEVFLASLALVLWSNMEPGAVRSILYNIMFIAGVSTVLFNINPLLRFDGYYILSDALEIPNLRARANQYLGYLVEKYLLGNKELKGLPSTGRERLWYVFFAVSSFVFRVAIVLGIILFIASKFFFVGVGLALWGLATLIVWPLFKGLRYLLTGRTLRRVRIRAVSVSAGLAATVIGLICYVPAPLCTFAEGVTWVPEQAVVRAGTEGFVVRLAAEPGRQVRRGDPLFILEDPTIQPRLKIVEAEIMELRARRDAVWLEHPVAAQKYEEEIAFREEALARERERIDELTVRSRTDGMLVIPRAQDAEGRFVRKGQLLGYVLDMKTLTARVVIPQESVGMVRNRTRKVDLRLVERLSDPIPVSIRREVPAASKKLPSSALGVQGGGQIVIDPQDAGGTTSFQKLFEFELEFPAATDVAHIGSRVFVRFDHGTETLASRWYRGLRLLFLSRFNV